PGAARPPRRRGLRRELTRRLRGEPLGSRPRTTRGGGSPPSRRSAAGERDRLVGVARGDEDRAPVVERVVEREQRRLVPPWRLLALVKPVATLFASSPTNQSGAI